MNSPKWGVVDGLSVCLLLYLPSNLILKSEEGHSNCRFLTEEQQPSMVGRVESPDAHVWTLGLSQG